jgi:hypothetical protein
MQSPEELTANLEQFRNPDGRSHLASRVQALPPELARIGIAYAHSSFDFLDYLYGTPRNQDKQLIENLSLPDRARLFTAFFPNLAEHVEAAWQFQKKAPYQVGPLRKAFRAPNNPEYTLNSRITWLHHLLDVLLLYNDQLEFVTEWGGHIDWTASGNAIGVLLAAVLDSQHQARDATYRTLLQIVNGEHRFALHASYAIRALLSSSQPGAWETVERLLLSAQRQEGLRQTIVEAVDLAHPVAFARILSLIQREKLFRFVAVARAVGVWFGIPIDSDQTKKLEEILGETLDNLEASQELPARIQTLRGQPLYLALWAQGFSDVSTATKSAQAITQDPEFERRYAAVHFLAHLETAPATQALLACLSDPDLRVAIKASEVIFEHSPLIVDEADVSQTFEALQQLIPRVPKEKQLPPAIWEWNRLTARRADITAKLIATRRNRPYSQLVPYLSAMDATGRQALVRALTNTSKKYNSLQPDERDLALSLISDPSNSVRQSAFQLLGEATLTGDEALAIEPLLARKAPDLRRGVIRLLLKQSAADCQASIERLSASSVALMKHAAEEIRFELEPKPQPKPSLHDGLGLYHPEERTSLVAPKKRLIGQLSTTSSQRLIQSLDELVHHHRETPVGFKTYWGQERQDLLGNLQWIDEKSELPLAPLWNQWWEEAQATHGATEEELARALFELLLRPGAWASSWEKQSIESVGSTIELKFHSLVQNILWHLFANHCTQRGVHLLLDILETYFCWLVENYRRPKDAPSAYQNDWRTYAVYFPERVFESCRLKHPEHWDQKLWRRYWLLLRWIDDGEPAARRRLPQLAVTIAAHQSGVASDADVYEQLFQGTGYEGTGRCELATVTRRKPHKLFESHPQLQMFANRCRARVLEVELSRGDLPTEASRAAISISAVYGGELALQIMKLLGDDPLSRGYRADSESKSVVFSHLLRVSLPTETDTLEGFAKSAKQSGISKKRLVDMALYAPQWAAHVERATGIVGLEEATYWLHAHTKDSQWTVDPEIRELWFAEVSERTPIPRQDLLDGAVDVAWFHRVRSSISSTEWKLLFDSAKFAAGGTGHKRAQLFAEAIVGDISPARLATQIREKRNQDAARALGLAPLSEDPTVRRQEILQRYELLQWFLRESRKFGALRQASEKLAYSISLANLARTAGYADPQRLAWSMEAEAIADLKTGPIEAIDGGVKATLAIDHLGEPFLTFDKNGKPLKDLPASLKKSPVLAPLRTRKTLLAQQTSRMRLSLEEAMIRGDTFTYRELEDFANHPLLRPMVATLIFVSDQNKAQWYASLKSTEEPFRIAHPVDLLASGQWPAFQRECIEKQLTQPFKQAFRELYIPTDAERESRDHSSRYEGNQIQPKQGSALMAGRGWINVPDEGFRKTFHSENISVWAWFLEGSITPAGIDGLTVQHVSFCSRREGKTIPIDQVNPRIFSEAMRDLDLLISVAHRGLVDPQTTASTIEMRSALLRETLSLLKIKNVRLENRHAFVDGKIGNYNIHLGSGTVHRQPGGSLCIIPVHSQHRGRVFLPFADNDPKTAEIVSKVLLLAQDDKIKDPTITEQLR